MRDKKRARVGPPSEVQLYLWSLDCIQAEIARATGFTDRAITAMLRGKVRLNPAVTEYLAREFGSDVAEKVQAMSKELFLAHPNRRHNKWAAS